MIVGIPTLFAIESVVTEFYSRLSLRALGLFVIHINGFRYGVYKPDATMLANSFDEVGRRIAERGQHTCPFASEPDAAKIANAVEQALYSDGEEQDCLLGLSRRELGHLLVSRDLLWAPDGDAAFDDGSRVLQFDYGDHVRVVAYKRTTSISLEPATLQDLWMAENDFYRTLYEWHDLFKADWTLGTETIGQ